MFLRPFCTRLFKDLKTYFRSSDYSAMAFESSVLWLANPKGKKRAA